MEKILAIIGIVILALALSYGMSVLLCGLGLWALCKLGLVAAWTWKQAALCAIVVEVIVACLRPIFRIEKS